MFLNPERADKLQGCPCIGLFRQSAHVTVRKNSLGDFTGEVFISAHSCLPSVHPQAPNVTQFTDLITIV